MSEDPTSGRIVINGKEYASADEMPPEIREVYERALELAADRDGNGVPDVLEGKGPGFVQTLRDAWGVAKAARKAGIESFELPRAKAEPGAAPTVKRPVAPASSPRPAPALEPVAVGRGRLVSLLVALALGAAWVAARELGLF